MIQIIEPDEYCTLDIDGTIFVYERLAVSDHERLTLQATDRGQLDNMQLWRAIVALKLRGWEHLLGSGGREVPSPAYGATSPEAEQQRQTVLARLPYAVLQPLAQAIMAQADPEVVKKNSLAPSVNDSALPAATQATSLPAPTVVPSAAPTDTTSPVIAAA